MPLAPPLRIVDGHCDTLWAAPKEDRSLEQRSLSGHVDLPRLLEAGVQVQFFALFSDPAHRQTGYTAEALAMIERFYHAVDRSGARLRPLLWQEDLASVGPDHVYGLLTIEGGEPLHGRVDLLHAFYRLGVRGLGLTWNHRNELADGIADGDSGGGLTSKGRSIVQEMERLGMVIDCSHLSDAGFWDLLECAQGPVIASHSNARALCPHPRNLTDEQIEAIAARGGVIGVNFLPDFLTGRSEGTIEDVIRHIEYLVERGGPSVVGLGSDFDGIGRTPVGLEDCTRLPILAEELLRRGYDEENVRAIMGENFLRYLAAVLPQRPSPS